MSDVSDLCTKGVAQLSLSTNKLDFDKIRSQSCNNAWRFHMKTEMLQMLLDKWHLICTQLEDLLCIGLLFQLSDGKTRNKLFDLNLKVVLQYGRGKLRNFTLFKKYIYINFLYLFIFFRTNCILIYLCFCIEYV